MDEMLRVRWIRKPEEKLKILLMERCVMLQGMVEFKVDGKTVQRHENGMLVGMGQLYAFASRTGTCKMINRMYGDIGGGMTYWFSTPVRTAGGQGANDFVTVQSTWTNTTGGAVTFGQCWLTAEGFVPVVYMEIATVDNDPVTVPNAAVLTVNWTVQIPSTTCHFSAAQRNDMAQGINPQGAPHGGSLYNFTHMQFVWAAGNSGLQAIGSYVGGTGYDQELTCTCDYLHAGAAVIVLECELYNSNGNLVEEITTLTEPLANGETIRGIHTSRYMGT